MPTIRRSTRRSIAAVAGTAVLTTLVAATAPAASAQGTAYATYNCAGQTGEVRFDRDAAGYLYAGGDNTTPPAEPARATLDLYFGTFSVLGMRNDTDPHRYASSSPTPAITTAPHTAVVTLDGPPPVTVTCQLTGAGTGFPI